MSAELRIFFPFNSSFLKCPRVHPCEGVCVFTITPFSYPTWRQLYFQLTTEDGALVDAWLWISQV